MIYTVQTIKGRKYIYKYGNIIYLDQIKEHLQEFISTGEVKGFICQKNRDFFIKNGIIDSSSFSTKLKVTPCKNVEKAKELYKYYFGEKSFCIKNPIMFIHDNAIDILMNLIFPGFILSEIFGKIIKKFTHKDL